MFFKAVSKVAVFAAGLATIAASKVGVFAQELSTNSNANDAGQQAAAKFLIGLGATAAVLGLVGHAIVIRNCCKGGPSMTQLTRNESAPNKTLH